MRTIVCLFCFVLTCGLGVAQDNIQKEKDGVRFVDLNEEPDDELITLDLALQSPKLTVIPDSVFEKTDLQRLDLAYNRIGIISKDILKLTKLKVLILSGNQYLTDLPDFLMEMESLETIYLQGMGTWSEKKKQEVVERFKSQKITIITQKME